MAAVLSTASMTASILLAFSLAAADSWWSSDRPSIRDMILKYKETHKFINVKSKKGPYTIYANSYFTG